MQLHQVEAEKLDVVEHCLQRRVLEHANEEGSARMRSQTRRLECEPIGRICSERPRLTQGVLSCSCPNGVDDLLGVSDGDVALALFGKDETKEVGACLGSRQSGFGRLQAANLD